MSIELLERAAEDLAPFLDDVVFVGGATVTLWMTDPAAAEPRPTKDVDVVSSRWHPAGRGTTSRHACARTDFSPTRPARSSAGGEVGTVSFCST
jgi:hypothetical protein